MIRWSPDSELASLHSAMDRLFDDFFGPAGPNGQAGQRQLPVYQLPLDVKETERGYEIRAAVPGFKPEEVEITFSDGILTVEAKHSAESTRQEGGYLRREISQGNYRRSLQVPGDVKADDTSASFENGILTITLPRVPRPQPKKIQIAAKADAKHVSGKA